VTEFSEDRYFDPDPTIRSHARAIYDQRALRTTWITYDMTPE